MLRLLEFIDDVVDQLDSRKEIEYIHTILAAVRLPMTNLKSTVKKRPERLLSND